MAEMNTLAGKNILVTGATGLIGAAVVRRVLREEPTATVYAAMRSAERAALLFAPWIGEGRVRLVDYDATRPLPGDDTYNYIIHAASGAAPAAFNSDPVGVMTANILGTRLLLDYGLGHGMERFLYISSGEVYGNPPTAEAETVWREDDSGYVNPMLPRSCYPTAKRAAETLCSAYAAEYGADIVVARPCHTYGPGFTPRDDRAYAQFLRRAAAGQDIVLTGPGTQTRAWIYVEDCAEAILTILLGGKSGEAYNVADEHSVVTIRRLAEIIAAAAGVSVTRPERAEAAPPAIRRAVFSTAKLQALGWKPRHTLGEALSATLHELKS